MNYNDLQRMKPYYSTLNYRYNNNNSIPKALPLIRNNRFDHSNVTVAPPIPSYYKQNINSSYYSKLPNIMNITYSSAEKIAQKFSNNLNNLRNLENQINDNNNVYNLPRIKKNEMDNNLKNEIKQGLDDKIENGKDEENIKNKIGQMRDVVGRLDDYKTEEQKKVIRNKELMSEEGINKFNVNLVSALSDYSTNIQKTITAKNSKDTAMYDMIKQGIDSLKNDFSLRIERFNKESQKNMDIMRKLMLNSANPRLKLLSDHLFAPSDIDQILKLREKNKNKNVVDTRRMSLLMQQAADRAREENEKLKKEELLNTIPQEDSKNNINNVGGGGEKVDLVPLDLWQRNRRNGQVINKAIKEKILFYGQNHFELQPLNRFRSIVFMVMAARRLLNVQYLLYKEFKFDSVSYYINNFEDMDIILKKLVYNTIKEPFLEILNNPDLEFNLTIDNIDNHEVYYTLQEYIQRIMKLFNTRFFAGISPEMFNYLSLYVTNYCFIPKDFFTTFELVRFRTTETGEFIELDNNSRKMILIFYIFIKILIRNIFLELMFNKADRKKVDLKIKLNIKMIVSVLYRTIIKNLIKNCFTKTNLDDIEDAEDMTAFLKVRFNKREFHLHRFLKKRYFLKVSQVEDKPKRISVRGKQPISPNSSGDEGGEDERSIRETNKTKNAKKKKKTEEIEKEENNDDTKKESDDEDSDEEDSKSKSKTKSGKTDDNKSGSNSDEDESESKSKSKSGSSEKKKKTKGRAPPPRNKDDSDEDSGSSSEEKSKTTKSKKTSNQQKSSKSKSETSNSKASKTSKSKSSKTSKSKSILDTKKKRNDSSSKIKEEDQEDEEEDVKINDDNYNEEREKLMPRRKISTEKVNGKVKKRLMGDEQKLKIAIRGKDPLRDKNTIKDFSKSDIDNMYFIIENYQSYGDDLDSNEVELLDRVLYTNHNLETYYLFAGEYNFDPGELVSSFADKLLERIQVNFSSKYED